MAPSNYYEKSLPASTRVRVAASCFGIAQEHHHSIVLLIENGLYGSSFSLLRCSFEAYVRGQWMSHCATDKQVQKYAEGWEPPRINELLAAVEQTPGFSERVLSRVKDQAWNAMCAYTHSGGLHIQRWNTSDGVEPNYSVFEVLEVIGFAESIGALSALGIVELANDDELALEMLVKFKER